MPKHRKRKVRSSFTLIELLVVIAIVAVLAVVVVVVLNPVELTRQARDSSRLQNLADINKALALFQVENPTIPATTSVVYISMPDTSATCANLGLPTLPSGWSYACAASSTVNKTDGTGWIPLNFSSLSAGSPVPSLPVDPINTTSSGSFYTFVTNGSSWHLTAGMESQKYGPGGSNDKASGDGGNSLGSYEVGTNLTLTPTEISEFKRDPSLVGYWPLDEGSGTTAQDASGNGNTGTLGGSPAWLASSSCKDNACLSFASSTSDKITVANSASLTIARDLTVSMWVNVPSANTGNNGFLHKKSNNSTQTGYAWYLNDGFGAGKSYFAYADGSVRTLKNMSTAINDGTWHFLAGTRTTGGLISIYKDGLLAGTSADASGNISSADQLIIGQGTAFYTGSMDEVRIYNRALSAGDILNLYNATK